ncbi:MAG: helicase-related protein, partial [Candidatus Methylumidiphilus sp.]
FHFSEDVEGFFNPMGTLAWEEALSQIDADDSLSQFFGQDARIAVTSALTGRVPVGSVVPLRDLHASAIVAGMRASAKGQMTVLGLEGNPGIGKTTAVVRHLQESEEGFLFLYVSPRVIINDDVTGNLAWDRVKEQPTGILTVTTNSTLIGAAKAWHDSQVREGQASHRKVDGAVVVEGVPGLKHPDGSTLILSARQKEELELAYIGSTSRKNPETDRQDRIEEVKRPGVIRVLASTTRALLKANPQVNRVVLTAAIQGYRESGGGNNTMQALDNLFRNRVDTKPGIAERREFAQRIPTIVVMVDELTGDGAGAPSIHAAAGWLDKQFIAPFQNQPQFRVVLIVSDASLGNEIVLDRYLNSGNRAPDKVLVSPSVGKRPFRLAATKVRMGGKARTVLHVMTNSYPASKLAIDYRVRLDVVRPVELPDGNMQTVRQAINEQQGEVLIANVVEEIRRAVAAGADQVIFFAQNKAFLRDVQTTLTGGEDGHRPLLPAGQVAIIDSSIPASQRKALLADDRRDQVKVFLMTSSGARGVSFPKTDWIIALMPRFGIEAALMEVAQLIYRGRGKTYTADDGTVRDDGDWKNRRLVMLLQDFMPEGCEPEPRLWLRQVSDLLTFLVMLRAAIYTRITGDAGLDRQKLALVPVGGIGSEEMLSLMSTHVRDFLSECEVFLRDSSSDKEHCGLIVNAKSNVERLFSKFSLDVTDRQGGLRSVARIADVQRFSNLASADNAPLLLDPQETPELLLPEDVYCVGPFWLEHLEKLDKQERFSIEGWLTNMDSQSNKLY